MQSEIGVGFDSPELVHAYINFIGADEPDHSSRIDSLAKRLGNSWRPYLELDYSSLTIAAACRYLARNEDPARGVSAMLDEVSERMSKVYRNESLGNRRLHLAAGYIMSLAELIERRNKPGAVDEYRQAVHEQAVVGYYELPDTPKRRGGGTGRGKSIASAGERSESNVIGVLARIAIDNFMVAPALPHHDSSPRAPSNYDLLMVWMESSEEKADARKVQIKSDCLGFCLHKSAGEASLVAHKIRERYDEDIVLVSGECDLSLGGLEGMPSSGGPSSSLASILCKEAKRGVDRLTASALNTVSQSLMSVIIEGDRSRRGLRIPESALLRGAEDVSGQAWRSLVRL